MTAQKHHYIPEFYLKKWCDPSGKLIEYCQRPVARNRLAIVSRSTSPGGTGYEPGLYSLHGASPEDVNALEEKFMRNTDGKAAVLRNVLLTGRDFEWDGRQRSAWSRFIMSLLQRNPEKVNWLKEHAVSWHASFDQYRRDELVRRGLEDLSTIKIINPYIISKTALNALEEIINLKSLGDFINQMHWAVTEIPKGAGSFLTSDRPIIMTDGLKYLHSFIALPISPTAIFYAVNDVKVQKAIAAAPPKDLVKNVNESVVRQAKKFVYACDQSQARFIENRLGKFQPQFIGGFPLSPPGNT